MKVGGEGGMGSLKRDPATTKYKKKKYFLKTQLSWLKI